jgi:hypothetical protein
MKPTWCTIYFSCYSHYTSTCFVLASCPLLGGNNVYMQSFIWLCLQPTKTYNTYQLLYAYIVISWRWATSKPETCRFIVTESTEDK